MIPIFILYDKNMNKIDYPKGITPLDIFVSSIEKERVTESLEGKSGSIDYGSIYKERPIELKFLLKANDTQSYRLLRDELYAVVDETEYVSETYQIGKRYKVKVDESYIPERYENNQRFAEIEVSCTTTELPFAESIGTSADIDRGGINSDDALWGYGMGLITDEDSLIYSREVKSGESFYVYNAGNVDIHPFEQDLNIAIKNFDRTSEPFEIKNITNGSEIKVNGKLNESDVVEIKGPNVTINNLAALRRTDRRYIELSKGWNEFVMTGAYKATIEFDFRFYYK